MTAPIRTVIVDDEPAARAAIRGLLGTDPEIDVVADCPDGGSALAVLQSEAPDLMFLDIQMPEMDGFTLLERVPPDHLPVIVFVTAYDQHALRAFEARALDYLLKPFDDERFFDCVARAKQRVRQGKLGAISGRMLELLTAVGGLPSPAQHRPAHLTRVMIRSDGRIAFVPVEDIDWVEADGDYVRIHAGRTCHQLRETMRSIETQLDPARFVRVHRSAIVNIDRIKELQPYYRGEYVLLLHDGSKLKLSRGHKTHLESALGRTF